MCNSICRHQTSSRLSINFGRRIIMSRTNIVTVLARNSTEKYFIEYNGDLSNHLSTGTIALHRLGVSDERIDRFIQWYSPKLESTSYDVVDERPAEELKGQRVAYYSIVKYYEKLLKNKYKTIAELIKHEYPKLSKGLCGAALHGTIHLGYGYSVRNERLVLEGLAYTFHSYLPLITSRSEDALAVFGRGSVSVTDVLKTLAMNKELARLMAEDIKQEKRKALKLGRFLSCASYLLEERGDLLTDLVLSLKFGQDVCASDGSLDTVKLARQMVYWSVIVYGLAETRNEFFLLHGVTSAWSLFQIIPLLKKEDGIKAVREFLTVLLAAYVGEGASKLNVPLMEDEFTDQDWDGLIKRAVDVDRDEHCYKLVQVCYEMAKDARDNGEDSNAYVHAARSALDHELHIHKDE